MDNKTGWKNDNGAVFVGLFKMNAGKIYDVISKGA